MSDKPICGRKELCLQAVREPEPGQRIAIVVESDHILGKDIRKFGAVWVDFGRAEVKRNGKLVHLTNLEFQLLRHLIEREGSPVPRDELLHSVWHYEAGTATRTVEVHVNHLRRKLEQDTRRPDLIVTVPGMGYKFIALGRL